METRAALRAVAHPVRLRILSLVTGKAVSATEIAAATGITHAAASYHLRQLAAAGLVEPTAVREVADRGAGRPLQLYQMKRAGLRGLERSSLEAIHHGLLRELEARLRRSDKVRTVDAEVWLTAADWREVLSLLKTAGEIVHQRARRPGSPRAKHVSFTSFLFQLRK